MTYNEIKDKWQKEEECVKEERVERREHTRKNGKKAKEGDKNGKIRIKKGGKI